MMLAKAKCKNVEAVHGDFLAVDPKDVKFTRVTHMFVQRIQKVRKLIFVQPLRSILQRLWNCKSTGSPIRNWFVPLPLYLYFLISVSYTEEEDESIMDMRLNKLAAFQLLMIRHAMKCTV